MFLRTIARTAEKGVFLSQVSLTWLHAGFASALLAIASEFGLDAMRAIFGRLSESQLAIANKVFRRVCLLAMLVCVAVGAFHFGECLRESLNWHPMTAHGVSFTLHAVLTWTLEIPKEI